MNKFHVNIWSKGNVNTVCTHLSNILYINMHKYIIPYYILFIMNYFIKSIINLIILKLNNMRDLYQYFSSINKKN